MPTNELFRIALALAEPWGVSKIEFSEDRQQLELWLNFPSGSRFACPECGHGGCGVYDSSARTWRHLNFFEYKTLLHARQPQLAREATLAVASPPSGDSSPRGGAPLR